ncbi:MAG TPA: HAD-IIIA family hydrolase, partial [Kofleriaceae bacterium]|nr:HAD-IIIA family hydrolase [Kofleriaceae bacterium]
EHHAALRGVPGGRVALARLAPQAQEGADQVGIDRALKSAVFLDRDGVINASVVKNGKPYPPTSVLAMEILPGVAEALARLRAAGFELVVVTNQPDVARGTQSRATIDAMHDRLQRELPLDAIYACFHDDVDACACRKPKPGLLLNAAQDRGIDLASSFMVGDRWRDTDAGLAAGCRAIFIDRGYSERKPERFAVNVAGLPDAAAWILEQI